MATRPGPQARKGNPSGSRVGGCEGAGKNAIGEFGGDEAVVTVDAAAGDVERFLGRDIAREVSAVARPVARNTSHRQVLTLAGRNETRTLSWRLRPFAVMVFPMVMRDIGIALCSLELQVEQQQPVMQDLQPHPPTPAAY